MGKAEQDFFSGDGFVVMGNTRRMRDAFNGLKKLGKKVYFVDVGFSKDDAAGKYSSLADLPDKVDAAICDGPRTKLIGYIDELAGAGINKVWINFLSDKPDVVAHAVSKNMEVLHGNCAVVWLPTVGPHHSIHRFLWKVLGKY